MTALPGIPEGRDARPAATQSAAERRYALIVVGFLAVVYSLNFMDRQIMSVLQEPIRREMGLSDTQLGALTGLSFALFYTAFGIPVAWASDRYRRVSIMSASCALWSLATAGCGLAGSFVQLATTRVLVAVGEAGGSPCSYSLIADYFPPSRRATGLALYSLGVPIGSALGVALGGWIAATHGWRTAFVAVGLPGVVLASLMLLVVREPERGRLDPAPAVSASGSILSELMAFASNPVMVLTAVASGLSAFVGYAMLSWNPSFLERAKGMSLAEIASVYSLILGLTGIVGTFGAGWAADRLAARDPRWYGWLPALCFTVCVPCIAGLIRVPGWRAALGFVTLLTLLGTAYLPPALAVIQNEARPAARGVAGATMLFILNLIGLGGGPIFVGRISDLARADGASQPLQIGYMALLPVGVTAIAAHLLVARAIGRRGLRAT